MANLVHQLAGDTLKALHNHRRRSFPLLTANVQPVGERNFKKVSSGLHVAKVIKSRAQGFRWLDGFGPHGNRR